MSKHDRENGENAVHIDALRRMQEAMNARGVAILRLRSERIASVRFYLDDVDGDTSEPGPAD